MSERKEDGYRFVCPLDVGFLMADTQYLNLGLRHLGMQIVVEDEREAEQSPDKGSREVGRIRPNGLGKRVRGY